MTIFCVIFLVLLLALLFFLYVYTDRKLSTMNLPLTSSERSRLKCASFIIKFGMILTAFGLSGVIGFGVAGLTTAMAFAIPKPTKVQPSSWFDHSHISATTMPFGAIVPIDWRFLLPGEKVKMKITGFARALQTKVPIMQDIDMKWGVFFVPLRLLSDYYEDIISKPTYPAADIDNIDTLNFEAHDRLTYVSKSIDGIHKSFPYFVVDKGFLSQFYKVAADNPDTNNALIAPFLTGGLMDYLGFPSVDIDTVKENVTALNGNFNDVKSHGSHVYSLLPNMAYHSICNHFFVPDWQRREAVESGDDYNEFPAGLTGYVPVDTSLSSNVGGFWNSSISDQPVKRLLWLRFSQYESDPFTCAKTGVATSRISMASTAIADDGGDAHFFNADTIRSIFALDEYARKIENFYADARKAIKYMFGVRVSDRSAMSPILVNAGSTIIQASELSNTAMQSVDSTQTRQSAGTLWSDFKKHFGGTFEAEEHGVFMTLCWIRPRTAYLRRYNPMFGIMIDNKSIPNPLFAEIGDCALDPDFVSWNPLEDATKDYTTNSVFGYNTRYVTMKHTCDSYSGDFRTNLAYWHCARAFDRSESNLTAGIGFNQVNPSYALSDAQSLNRIFSVIQNVQGVRPFEVHFRFDEQIYQPYPHIDNEL